MVSFPPFYFESWKLHLDSFDSFETLVEKIQYVHTKMCESGSFLRGLRQFWEMSPQIKNHEDCLLSKTTASDLFSKQQFTFALRKYTEALLNSTDMVESSKLCANRAAILIKLEKYPDALVNCELALAYGYPTDLRWKIFFRRGVCRLHILEEDVLHIENDFLIAKKQCLRPTDLALIDHYLHLLKTYSQQSSSSAPPLPTIHRHIEKKLLGDNKNDNNHGMFADTLLPPGTCLHLEQPLAFVLDQQALFSLEFCHFCGKEASSILIPCSSCPAPVGWCNVDCQEKDPLHRFFCGSPQLLHDIPEALLLSWILFTDPEKKSISNTLIDHLDEIHPVKLLEYIYHAIVLFLYLSSDRDHGDSINHTMIADMVKLLAKLEVNAFSVSRTVSKQQVGTSHISYSHQKIGSAVYHHASFFNHSCLPNSSQTFVDNAIVIHSSQPIERDEEVCISYGPLATSEKSKRQDFLKNHYYFECKCVACEREKNCSTVYCCPFGDCQKGSLFEKEQDVFYCVKCLRTLENHMTQKILRDEHEASDIYQSAITILNTYLIDDDDDDDNTKDANENRKEDLKETLRLLLQCLTYQESLYIPTNRNLAETYDTVAQVYTLLEDYDHAIPFCRRGLNILIKLFPPNSLELAYEYFKFATLLFNNEDVAESLSTCEKALATFTQHGFSESNSPECKEILDMKSLLMDRLKQEVGMYWGC